MEYTKLILPLSKDNWLFEQGQLTANGTISKNNISCTTNFIPIEYIGIVNKTRFTCKYGSTSRNNYARLCIYDKNFKFIKTFLARFTSVSEEVFLDYYTNTGDLQEVVCKIGTFKSKEANEIIKYRTTNKGGYFRFSIFVPLAEMDLNRFDISQFKRNDLYLMEYDNRTSFNNIDKTFINLIPEKYTKLQNSLAFKNHLINTHKRKEKI